MTDEKMLRIVRETRNLVWNMSRQLYPIGCLLMDTDFRAYKKHNINEMLTQIHEHHKKLEDAIRDMHDDMKGESSDD